MALGPWEGLTEAEVSQRYPVEYHNWITRPDDLRVSGRETLQDVAARMASAVREAESLDVPVLLVTHVALIRVAVLRVLGWPLNRYKQIDVPNATVFAMRSQGGDVRRLDGCLQSTIEPGQDTSLESSV
jgi:broad specificity phosphatase PhoE